MRSGQRAALCASVLVLEGPRPGPLQSPTSASVSLLPRWLSGGCLSVPSLVRMITSVASGPHSSTTPHRAHNRSRVDICVGWAVDYFAHRCQHVRVRPPPSPACPGQHAWADMPLDMLYDARRRVAARGVSVVIALVSGSRITGFHPRGPVGPCVLLPPISSSLFPVRWSSRPLSSQ